MSSQGVFRSAGTGNHFFIRPWPTIGPLLFESTHLGSYRCGAVVIEES
jgi:hypothetical protein